MERPVRARGRIVRIYQDNHFGFVREEGADTKGDHFFHQNTCQPRGLFHDLQEGDLVTFTKATSPKGPRAEAVSRLTDESTVLHEDEAEHA